MKKIIAFLALGLSITSCSLKNDEPTYTYETVPVSGVDLPTAYAVDSVTQIKVSYIRPSTCHFFNGFDYQIDGMNRIVGVGTIVSQESNCQADNSTSVQVNLKFKPLATGAYNFKFWAGKNAAGEDQYLIKQAVVTH